MSEGEDLEYMCNIFVASKRPADALLVLKEMIELDPQFDYNRRIIFQIVYKQMIDAMRETLRILTSYSEVEQELGHQAILKALENKKIQISQQLIHACKECLDVIDGTLLPACDGNPEAAAFYIKFKADLNRYISEFSDETESLSALNQAEKNYQEAIEICAVNFPKSHPIYLSCILNASVFQYEQKKNPTAATEMCESAIATFDQGFQELPPNAQEESRELIHLMRQNLYTWGNEAAEEEAQ